MTGSDRFDWLKRLWRERRPFVVSMLVLIIGVPVVIVIAQLSDQDKNVPAVDTAVKQAQKATDDGDYADAYDKLKAIEGQTMSKQQKLALYTDLAAAAANAEKVQEAIDYLQKKHALEPSSAVADAYTLARLYERNSDKANALTQYRVALDYYKQKPQGDPVTMQSMVEATQAAIAELEANDE